MSHIQLDTPLTPLDAVPSLTDAAGDKWPAGAVAYPTNAGPTYTLQIVDLTHGLPVVGQTGAVWDYNLKQYGGSAVGATNAVHVQPGTGAVFAASQSGTWNLGTVATLTGITNVVHIDDNGGSVTVDGTVSISGSVTATGPLTDTQLRASAVPVSLATLPALVAGTAVIGKVTTDQTTHGTTDLVAADITKVAGAAISQGHGTAATAIRVELPTDGTGTVGLNAGTAVVGKVGVDQTTPGTTNLVEAKTNVRRGTQVLHRNAVAAADVLANPSSSAPTVADVTTAGSLAFNTVYRAAFAAGNTQGNTLCSGVASQTTANDAASTHGVRLTIPQVASATYYDVFLSTDTAPKWVARITETQRAAAGTTITAVGTVGTGGPNAAGTVDIRVVGTGQQTSAQNFQQNTAYVTTATAYNAAGSSQVRVQVQVALTDLRTAPTLVLVPAWLNDLNAGQYHLGQPLQVPLASGSGAALFQEFVLDTNGSSGLIILIDSTSGQGIAVSVWTQPA